MNTNTTQKSIWLIIYKGMRHPDWYFTKLERDSVVIEHDGEHGRGTQWVDRR